MCPNSRNGPGQASGPLRSRMGFADPFLRLLLACEQLKGMPETKPLALRRR
jgi:hypothetical protein